MKYKFLTDTLCTQRFNRMYAHTLQESCIRSKNISWNPSRLNFLKVVEFIMLVPISEAAEKIISFGV